MRRSFKVLSFILVVILIIALISHLLVNVEVLDEVPMVKKEPSTKVIGLISDTKGGRGRGYFHHQQTEDSSLHPKLTEPLRA